MSNEIPETVWILTSRGITRARVKSRTRGKVTVSINFREYAFPNGAVKTDAEAAAIQQAERDRYARIHGTGNGLRASADETLRQIEKERSQ